MTREQLLAELTAERFGRLEDLEMERAGVPAWLRRRDQELVDAIHRHERRAA